MSERSPAVSKGVFVFLEQVNGELENVSLEVLGKARDMADKLRTSVTGILLGNGVAGLAEECARRGADMVLRAESPLLKDYTTEAYLKVVSKIVIERDPDILLFGATHNGTSLAASLAVRAGAGLMAHVVDLEIEDGTGMLLGSVPGFGGSIVAVCKCKKGRPQMATVRPGVFKALPISESRRGVVENVPVSLQPEDVRQTVIEKKIGQSPDISRAEKVVVAGLGCSGELDLAKKLAEAVGANLAVSRPLADKGIAPKDIVVGSTGSSLNAKLVIVLGISGASHFISGIKDARSVIAINTDPDAQIFKHADYCVVGNIKEIVPRLASELGARSG